MRYCAQQKPCQYPHSHLPHRHFAVNNFTPLPIEFVALTPNASEAAGLKLNYGGGYNGGNAKWPCWGASLAYWVRWMRQRHGYRLLTTDHNNNALFAPMDEPMPPPMGAGAMAAGASSSLLATSMPGAPLGEGLEAVASRLEGIASRLERAVYQSAGMAETTIGGGSLGGSLTEMSEADMWCHGGMTTANLYRLRLCRRSDHSCAFTKLLRFPSLVPSEEQVAANTAALTALLAPGIHSIYLNCDAYQVPFSLRVDGVCCPGASMQPGKPGNGSLCHCSGLGGAALG